jgi:trigger factor
MTDEQLTPEATQTETPAEGTEPQAEGAAAEGTEPEEKPLPKLVQNVEMRDVGPCKKHIRVAIERDSIEARLGAKLDKLVPESYVAGFRPGKAPRALVQRRYRKEVSEQVKAEVLLESLEQLAEEHHVAPLTAPDLDPYQIELPKEGPLVYEFEVEVRPEFDLPNYKGLKLRRPVQEFGNEDVAREKRRLLAPYGQVIPKEGGSAEVGDVVVADVTTRDGDRQLGTINDFMTRVESQLAFKDGVADHFEEQIRGARPGDTRVVDVTLSTGVADASLQSKKVQANFHVKEVKEVRLPELTHEFLHRFGVHSEEQFDELVRVVLQRRLEYQQRQAARQQVLQQIAAATTWDLPKELLARQARKTLARRVMEMRNNGIPEEEIEGRRRLLEQDVWQSTELALKEHFVLQKIAEVENIEVSDDDLDAEIERIAEQNNESPRRLRARLEREELLDALAAEVIERQALDLILANAEYEDVPVGREQQRQQDVATVDQQAVPGEMHDPTEMAGEEAETPAGEAGATETPAS